ncbi:MAG: DUF1015 domain-containing protein [Verrucomicrobiales bacterium]
MRIRTFQGLVPAPGRETEVAAVPYDVVNREEAAALVVDSPDNLLHVDRAEVDLPAEVDAYSEAVYSKAAETFERMQADGVLVREPEPCVYLYKQTMGDHSQVGIVAVCHVDDYRDDIIRKHEKTRPVKEDDRTRLVDALGANTGPIFLTYKEDAAVDALVDSITAGEAPVCDFVADDGIGHVLWRVPNGGGLVEAFDAVPLSYVADGHHRSASAFRVANERRAANPDHDGTEDYNWFLCVLFPANQLKILAYNRAVKDLCGMAPAEFLETLGGEFEVSKAEETVPPVAGEVRMYLDGTWYGLKWGKDADADPVSALDVSVLQDRLLEPVLGIADPRTDDRIAFVGGIRGSEELERLVDSGKAAVAFAVYPVSVEELMAIADAGQIMAPKCTWFEPKLRSGLFIHTF